MLLLMSRLHGGELARELLGCLQLAVAKFRGRFDLAAFVPFIPAGHQDPVRVGGDGLLPHDPVGFTLVSVCNWARRQARRLHGIVVAGNNGNAGDPLWSGDVDPIREGRRRPASDLVEGFALGKPSRVVGVDAVKNGGSFGRNLVSDEHGPSGILLPKGGDYFFPAIELELPDCATIDED